jgi:hypothetical protein
MRKIVIIISLIVLISCSKDDTIVPQNNTADTTQVDTVKVERKIKGR